MGKSVNEHVPVKVGVLLPTREAAIRGQYSVGPLLDLALRAEESGFDSVWAGDSLLARPRLDPLIVLSACAAVTRRVHLGTAALIAALRHPLIGASMLTSMEHAAPGRLRIGVGAGFGAPESEREFSAVGVPFSRRSARLDETVQLWKKAWNSGGGSASAFHGEIWDIDGLERLPEPATPEGPGVWLAAGAGSSVLSRTAALYDGWLPFLPDPEEYRRSWNRIVRLAEEEGRPPGSVEPGLYVTVLVDGDPARARATLEDYVQGYYGRSLEFMSALQAFCYGSAEDCARQLAGFIDAGARHLVLRIGTLDPAGQLDILAGDLLPALRAQPAMADR